MIKVIGETRYSGPTWLEMSALFKAYPTERTGIDSGMHVGFSGGKALGGYCASGLAEDSLKPARPAGAEYSR